MQAVRRTLTKKSFIKPTIKYHRLTLRYPLEYHNWLQVLSLKTDLDISQIIRLAIHFADRQPDFRQMIRIYEREDRKHIAHFPSWETEEKKYLWKK